MSQEPPPVHQAAKFAARPDIQQRIAEARPAREVAAIGRTPSLGIDPGWNAQCVHVIRWVLRMKRETNRAEIDACWQPPTTGPSSRSPHAPPLVVHERDPAMGRPDLEVVR